MSVPPAASVPPAPGRAYHPEGIELTYGRVQAEALRVDLHDRRVEFEQVGVVPVEALGHQSGAIVSTYL